MVFYAPQGLPRIPRGPQSVPPKKRSGFKTFMIVIGAIVAGFFGLFIFLAMLGAIFFSGDDEPMDAAAADALITSAPSKSGAQEQEASKPVEKKPDAETTYAIGQPVKSKKFEYVIIDFKCGIPSIGEHEITKEIAKGQFCSLAITAKNIAKRAEDLDFDDFKLMSNDVEYSTDSWVNITAKSDSDTSGFLDQINPGLQVAGSIYFDAPLDVTPDRAMIDDVLFGTAATVSLKE